MKNDKLIEFIENTLRKVYSDTYELKVFYDSNEGILVYVRDNKTYPRLVLHFSYAYNTRGCMEIDSGYSKITTEELEAFYKICVAIKNDIFK